MSKLRSIFENNQHSMLLGSLLVLLFGHLIVPKMLLADFVPVFLMQNVVVSLLIFSEKKIWTITLALFLLFLIVQFYLIPDPKGEIKSTVGFAYIIYFIMISTKVYHKIYASKIVGRELISAVFSGFIMLSTIGSFIFLSIELFSPNSFSNLGEGVVKYHNIRYFSFITTLTIGYGDIVPISNIAKNFTILIGLAGNFYSVIVTGIVLGKFVSEKRNV
ncbi:MAG: ion channel [Crocinitomicaceae bacterium]|nr:ion channel [Crocinitomicaceae bacterium]